MNKSCFTLAEVLITLSILGVVAAISIPNIIQNYQKQATVSRLKMAYSMLDRLTQQSYIENGFPPISEGFTEQIFQNYFGKYLNISKYCGQSGKGCFKQKTYMQNYNDTDNVKDKDGNDAKTDMWSDLDGKSSNQGGYGPTTYYKVILKNGMSFGVAKNNAKIYGYALVVDIDGPNRGDSKLGQDVFQFVYSSDTLNSYIRANDDNEQVRSVTGCQQTGIFPGGYSVRGTSCDTPRSTFINYCKQNGSYMHGIKNGAGCAGLIIKDGWKISPDYPWSYAHKK